MASRRPFSACVVVVAAVLSGCGGLLTGGGGMLAHGGGVTAVEETARASLGIAGADDDRRGALEVAGEVGFGQRLDAPGETRRYSAIVDMRYQPAAFARGPWSAFWLAGASWEFLTVEGFRDQMGAFAHLGLGGTYRLEFSRSEHGLWAGAMLEAVGGVLATVKATSAAEAAAPELPTAGYAGLRLSVMFEWWMFISTR